MSIDGKRFIRNYQPTADAISRLDIAQVDREAVAAAVADGIDSVVKKLPGWNRDLFVGIASDPLCKCAGANGEPCPHGREIRIAMHLRGAPNGRSFAWAPRKPEMRCISCGAKEFRKGVAA